MLIAAHTTLIATLVSLFAIVSAFSAADFAAAVANRREKKLTGRAVILLWLTRLGVPLRDQEDMVQVVLQQGLQSLSTFDPDRVPGDPRCSSHRGAFSAADFAVAVANLREKKLTGRAVILLWLTRLGVPLRDQEDMVQVVLLQGFQSLSTFDPDRVPGDPQRSFHRWMNRIAVNASADYHRRAIAESRLAEHLTPHPWEEAPPPEPVPPFDEAVEAAEDRAQLLAAVEALEPTQRAIIKGYFLDERIMKEITANLGLKLRHGYKLRDQGLRLLRKNLSESVVPTEEENQATERARMIAARAFARALRIDPVSVDVLVRWDYGSEPFMDIARAHGLNKHQAIARLRNARVRFQRALPRLALVAAERGYIPMALAAIQLLLEIRGTPDEDE